MKITQPTDYSCIVAWVLRQNDTLQGWSRSFVTGRFFNQIWGTKTRDATSYDRVGIMATLDFRCKNRFPADTLRNNDVVITSKRRHFDVITSKWRRFDVITTFLLRHISAGIDSSQSEIIRTQIFKISNNFVVFSPRHNISLQILIKLNIFV